MPHARITVRKPACLSASAVDDLLKQVRALTTVPLEQNKAPKQGCLLLATYGSRPSIRTQPVECHESLPKGFESVETALSQLYRRFDCVLRRRPATRLASVTGAC